MKKNWKKFAIGFALVATMIMTGAGSCSSGQSSTKATTNAIRATQDEGVKAFDDQRKAVPYPEAQLRNSLERQNLRERLLRFNQPNRIGYVYMVSFGKILGYWTIKGKISSTDSQMTNATWVTKWVCPGSCNDSVGPVDAATDDGSFGPNENMVFFFTTSGAMVQMPKEDVVYSDQPISIGGLTEFTGQPKP